MDHVLFEGTPVRAADGAKIGSIKEVSGRYFKVNAPFRRDYWLDSEDVKLFDAFEDVVWLTFPKSQLSEHKVGPPTNQPTAA